MVGAIFDVGYDGFEVRLRRSITKFETTSSFGITKAATTCSFNPFIQRFQEARKHEKIQNQKKQLISGQAPR
jgi:hypothetical protein